MNRRRNQQRLIAALIGGVAAIACLLLAFDAPRPVLLAWLSAWLFFLALALGGLPMLMVHALTGGRWGEELRPGVLAAARLLPLLALGLLPVLIGARWLYPWADPQFALDPDLDRQRWYLNLPFFWLRAVICMGVWLWLARAVTLRLAQSHPPRLSRGFAAFGLAIYALTITIAAVDWIGSLVPQWHSSTFGLTVGTAQLLSATAFALVLACRRADPPPAERLRDLGTLLMALVLGWGYLAFMDFLTAWIADLPPEVAWYWPRLKTAWFWLGAALVVLDLIVPFVILLSRRAKQHRGALLGVACVLLAAQIAFALWLVLPGIWSPTMLAACSLPLAWIAMAASCIACVDWLPLASARSQDRAPGVRAEQPEAAA